MNITSSSYSYQPLAEVSSDDPTSPKPRSSSLFARAVFIPIRLARRASKSTLFKRLILYTAIAFVVLIVATYFFNPSYANPSPYVVPKSARVFIAANIVDGQYRPGSQGGLVDGKWGDALLGLAVMLKAHNIPLYISVYGGPTPAIEALESRLSMLDIPRSIVAEDLNPIDLSTLPKLEIPNGKYKGEKRTKRVAFLSAVRNKALEPLASSEERYTHLLFLNDVIYRPIDAMRLLFGTNLEPSSNNTEAGHPSTALSFPPYRAACALDFISSWKFYDTYASRDVDGYGVGIPIFPWFARGATRNDLIAGRDSVEVKSCWGGMVAFEARFFQALLPQSTNASAELHDTDSKAYLDWARNTLPKSSASKLPVRFRAEPHPFWDASECCLIHADISPTLPASSHSYSHSNKQSTGIFINPYVRTAYDSSTFKLLPFAQRLERLFILPQTIIDFFAGMPHLNILRDKTGTRSYIPDAEVLGDIEAVNNAGEGVAEDVKDGFCQVRQLLLLKEGRLRPGELNWEKVADVIPPLH